MAASRKAERLKRVYSRMLLKKDVQSSKLTQYPISHLTSLRSFGVNCRRENDTFHTGRIVPPLVTCV
jgi:hypothetical protein